MKIAGNPSCFHSYNFINIFQPYNILHFGAQETRQYRAPLEPNPLRRLRNVFPLGVSKRVLFNGSQFPSDRLQFVLISGPRTKEARPSLRIQYSSIRKYGMVRNPASRHAKDPIDSMKYSKNNSSALVHLTCFNSTEETKRSFSVIFWRRNRGECKRIHCHYHILLLHVQ